MHNIIRTISKSGLCSRKQALELVKSGKVRMGGKVVLDPGLKVGHSGKITVSGKPLGRKAKRYILLNKPAGYVTTRNDELRRPTVYEFLKDVNDWVFPVGRLDRESSGLLIFTNDTKFGNALTDPKYGVERTYEVLIRGTLGEDEIKRIMKGVDIGCGEKTKPTHLKVINEKEGSALVEITLNEGKNREIRRLFECLGKPVKRLLRTRYGSFRLGTIKPGKWVEIRGIDIAKTRERER